MPSNHNTSASLPNPHLGPLKLSPLWEAEADGSLSLKSTWSTQGLRHQWIGVGRERTSIQGGDLE